MEDKIQLHVVTAGGSVFDRKISYCNLPTTFGSVGILAGHAPMLCAIEQGRVFCRFDGDGSAHIAVSGGIANVEENEVTVLVSDAKVIEE